VLSKYGLGLSASTAPTPTPVPTPTITGAPVEGLPRAKVSEEAPPAFIQIPGTPDKFGMPTTKTVTNPEYELWETKQKEKIKAKTEVLKLSEKARANFGRSTSMFKNIVAQVKGAKEEQGGLGLLPGAYGQMMAGIRRPGFGRVASAYGQRVETALSLNSILTGQNRVIRSVVNMVMGTLPAGIPKCKDSPG